MFNPPEKFNAPKFPALEKPDDTPSEFQERNESLTKNERHVLDNLTRPAARFNGDLKDLNDRRLVPDSAKYIRAFEGEPKQIEGAVKEAEVLEAIIKSDLVFLGDYHNLSKSQNFVAETIEKMSRASTKPSVLAIEFVEHSKAGQKALDDFMSGEIGEEEFLKKIKFKKWSNPEHWPAYKHILDSAKGSGVRVYGINTDRKEKTLSETDEKIAGNLQNIAQQNPGSRILVHIGESHLSEDHLPRQLATLDEFKQKKPLTIFQNLPSVYFNALKKYKKFHIPKSFKIKSQNPTYNLITAPLITRLVADIEYLQLGEDRSEYDEAQIDFLTTDTSYELVRRIVNTLKLKRREDKYDMVPSVFSAEFEIEKKLEFFRKSKLAEIFKPYFEILNQKGSVYIPGSKDGRCRIDAALIIKRFRLKKVLEELAKFIANPDKKVEDFAKLSPVEQKRLRSFQYLCSKVFIPERTPSNEEEGEGERMFENFLAGEKIVASGL